MFSKAQATHESLNTAKSLIRELLIFRRAPQPKVVYALRAPEARAEKFWDFGYLNKQKYRKITKSNPQPSLLGKGYRSKKQNDAIVIVCFARISRQIWNMLPASAEGTSKKNWVPWPKFHISYHSSLKHPCKSESQN